VLDTCCFFLSVTNIHTPPSLPPSVLLRHICVAAKIPHVTKLAQDAIRDGKCVVIGLLSTGEAVAKRYVKNRAGSAARTAAAAALGGAGGGGGGGRGGGRPARKSAEKVVSYKAMLGSDSEEEEEGGKEGGKEGEDTKMEVGAGAGGGKGKAKAKARRSSASSSALDDDDEEYKGKSDEEEEEEGGGGGAAAVAGAKKGGGGGRRRSRAGDDDDEEEEEDSEGEEEEDGGEDEDDDGFVGIESTLLDLIKKYVPDMGLCQKPDVPFNYSEKKAYLIDRVRAQDLPQFPLDDLILSLGGHGKVAEITGRKCRLGYDRDGNPVEISRAKTLGVSQKRVNIEEMRAFQAGGKLVAIISDAGSTGISLHADRRAKNQRRRVHMTLEIPYNSSSFVQQLGRSHRSNQVSGVRFSCVCLLPPRQVLALPPSLPPFFPPSVGPNINASLIYLTPPSLPPSLPPFQPQYMTVVTDLPGEIRFAAVSARGPG